MDKEGIFSGKYMIIKLRKGGDIFFIVKKYTLVSQGVPF